MCVLIKVRREQATRHTVVESILQFEITHLLDDAFKSTIYRGIKKVPCLSKRPFVLLL